MNQTRIALEACQRVEMAAEAFDVLARNGLTPVEKRTMRAMLWDCVSSCRAVNASDQLARAIGRARTPRTIQQLSERYQQQVDELPERQDAA